MFQSLAHAHGVVFRKADFAMETDDGRIGFDLNQTCQPHASRTFSIVSRIVFQVLGSSSVAFGNMQPSQQICWMPRSVAPLSQYFAVATISSLPFGSSARQCRPVLSCDPEPCTVPSF